MRGVDIVAPLRSEMDFDVNRRAETEIQGLARTLQSMSDKIEDVDALLRKERGERAGT